MTRERVLLALLLLLSVISVAIFATLTPRGRAPDEFRYYGDIQQFAEKGELTSAATGHPPLYTVVASVPYRLGQTPGEKQLLVRLLGMLFMAVTVAATYGTSAELFEEGTLGRWLPPLLVAVVPQFAFISASINSDALLATIAALFTYLCVRLIRRPPALAPVAAVAVVSVLGVLAKQRFLVLLPLLVPVLGLAAARALGKLDARWLRRTLVSVAAAGTAALGLGLLALVSSLAPGGVPRGDVGVWMDRVPALITRDFFVDLFATFWGYFDWLALPMHTAAYLAFGALVAVACLGLIAAAAGRLRRAGLGRFFSGDEALAWLFLGGAVVLAVASVVAYRVTGLASQGRYLFIALVPFALFIGRGVAEVVPARSSRLAFQALTLLLVGVFFAEVVFRLIPYYY